MAVVAVSSQNYSLQSVSPPTLGDLRKKFALKGRSANKFSEMARASFFFVFMACCPCSPRRCASRSQNLEDDEKIGVGRKLATGVDHSQPIGTCGEQCTKVARSSSRFCPAA